MRSILWFYGPLFTVPMNLWTGAGWTSTGCPEDWEGNWNELIVPGIVPKWERGFSHYYWGKQTFKYSPSGDGSTILVAEMPSVRWEGQSGLSVVAVGKYEVLSRRPGNAQCLSWAKIEAEEVFTGYIPGEDYWEAIKADRYWPRLPK